MRGWGESRREEGVVIARTGSGRPSPVLKRLLAFSCVVRVSLGPFHQPGRMARALSKGGKGSGSWNCLSDEEWEVGP